jgi:hypothetical protein
MFIISNVLISKSPIPKVFPLENSFMLENVEKKMECP